MKIRLAILDRDTGYIERLTAALCLQYGGELQIHGFTDQMAAIKALSEECVQVFLADEAFLIDARQLPDGCEFAYLVSGSGVEALNGQRAINKFQRVDAIYRAILDLFAENAGNISLRADSEGRARVAVFSSPCGGTGTSSMAAAYAVRMAGQGLRVCYLNLEPFGSGDALFSGEGQLGMDEVIFAIKSKRGNLALKLEGCVRRDASGVCFFAPPKIALDLMELTAEERVGLVEALRDTGSYDLVVVDMDFFVDEGALRVFRLAEALVWVGDGEENSNQKIRRAYDTLRLLDERTGSSCADRVFLLYNKFSNKTGHIVQELSDKNLGGVPRLEHATAAQVLSHLARQRFLDDLLTW